MCSPGRDVIFKFLIKLKSKIPRPLCGSWCFLPYPSAFPFQNPWAHSRGDSCLGTTVGKGVKSQVLTGVHYTASLEINPPLSLSKWSFTDFPSLPFLGTKHTRSTFELLSALPFSCSSHAGEVEMSCFTFLFKINNFVALWLTFETLHCFHLAGLPWAL